MRLLGTLFAVALLFSVLGCGARLPKTPPAPAETPPPAPPAPSVLIVTPAASPIRLERGTPVEVALAVAWSDTQTQAVTLTVSAETPRWLVIALPADSVQPPATVSLTLSAAPGGGVPGPTTLVLLASNTGSQGVQRIEIPVVLHRVAGTFTAVEPRAESQACSTLCGRIDPQFQLDFYDLVPGQDCAADPALPDAQRIGGRTYPLSERGFGYGSACGVAVVWESTGTLSLVNLGLSRGLARGAVLTSLRGGADVWLSVDNTVALVRFAELLVPFDIPTGRQLGAPCGADGAIPTPALRGDSLKAGPCAWQIL